MGMLLLKSHKILTLKIGLTKEIQISGNNNDDDANVS